MMVIIGDESNAADLEEQEAIRPTELAGGVSLTKLAPGRRAHAHNFLQRLSVFKFDFIHCGRL
jgi:hypothetical protein